MYRLLFTICANSPVLNAKFCHCSMVVLSCKQNFLWMFVHSKAVKLWCQYCWVWKHNKWDGEWRYNYILQIAEENHGFSFPVWLCTKIIIKLCFFKSKRKLFHECDAKFRSFKSFSEERVTHAICTWIILDLMLWATPGHGQQPPYFLADVVWARMPGGGPGTLGKST